MHGSRFTALPRCMPPPSSISSTRPSPIRRRLYEYQPRTPQNMRAWFAEKKAGRFPVIGAEQAGVLLGFATYGTFRARAAYKYTVEHSVYVHKDHRGRGIGMALMQRADRAGARSSSTTCWSAASMSPMPSACAMHERLGFTHAGTIRQAAFKFGRWLDLGFYQLILETPANPRRRLTPQRARATARCLRHGQRRHGQDAPHRGGRRQHMGRLAPRP